MRERKKMGREIERREIEMRLKRSWKKELSKREERERENGRNMPKV
jgi:hypothetical protein